MAEVDNKRRRVFWSYRQVCTQDNVAGGSLIVTVTPPVNSAFVNNRSSIAASGNRAVSLRHANADGILSLMNSVAAAAGAVAQIPCAPSASAGSGGNTGGKDEAIANPEYMYGIVESAAQTETATLLISAELFGSAAAPTVSWAGSSGTPNAAAATENTLTVVYV